MKWRLKKGAAGEQRGAVIVFTALSLMFLMMFVAFGVDFANYHTHQSRLQHAADAAALAGIAQYADSEYAGYTSNMPVKGRLVALPANITEGKDGQAAAFSANSYTFTKITNGVPFDVRSQAEEYISNNYVQNNSNRSGVTMVDSMWNAAPESTSTSTETTTGGITQTVTTTTMTKRSCYRVDLEDTVTTFFARIFGVETLPVKVSAMAMLDGTKSVTDEDTFIQISEQISKIAANYVWETVTRYSGIITDEKTGKQEWTLSKDFSDDPNVRPTALGENDTRYFVVTGGGNSSRADVVTKDPKTKDGKIILGYKEPENPNSICAEPILYEGPLTDWDDKSIKYYVTTRIFEIDENYRKEGVMEYKGKDIQALYLNRDHIGQRAGPWEKFTEIKIGRITGKTTSPLYLRLESEPVCMSSNGTAVMMAHGTTVEVELDAAQVAGSRQFVLAYDGPDPKRGEYDAPWIPIREVTIGGEPFYPGETFVPDYSPSKKLVRSFNPHDPKNKSLPHESLLKWYKGKDFPEGLVQTAGKTSGPIDVYIGSGKVLYGAIFAPRSKVIIHGGGEIRGFILAQEIEIQDGSYKVGKQVVEMPVLVAERPTTNYQQFHYRREYIKAEFSLASSYNLNMLDTSFMEL